ncbi:hypothetical protein, partial [Burkholderia gladioli]|uniref:hypothetical protein n=1 Tax=Burkholderia gladioli TaxID=28095 RepID=UPI0005638864
MSTKALDPLLRQFAEKRLAQQGVEGFGAHGSGLPDVRLLGLRVLVGLLQWISHGVLPEMDVRGPRRESA